MMHRLVHDFAAILVADELSSATRACGWPTSRTAPPGWVISSTACRLHGQNPGMFKKNPADQFTEHCGWHRSSRTASSSLAKYLPVERILFGSDWPHAEGVGHPRDFFHKVAEFSLADQRKIMRDNAREVTRPETAIDGVA